MTFRCLEWFVAWQYCIRRMNHLQSSHKSVSMLTDFVPCSIKSRTFEADTSHVDQKDFRILGSAIVKVIDLPDSVFATSKSAQKT